MSTRATPGRLHVITDVTLQDRFSHVELGRIVADAGAEVVQFRDKRDLPEAERRRIAAGLRDALNGIPLVVNDHLRVARACAAAGVHLGRHDTPWSSAREQLGPRPWIGWTANSLEQARAADDEAVDYLGVGPVFGTTSKAAPAPRLGLDGLSRIVQAVGRPVVAIGGIDPDNLASVLETGVHGVAVLSCVARSPQPDRIVEALRIQIERCAGSPHSRSAAGEAY